jgi:hypothetical protein
MESFFGVTAVSRLSLMIVCPGFGKPYLMARVE